MTQENRLADRVHFLGIRTDVPQLLHAADYIVMSSHFEGLSLSSVEGMSVGKPFLASDVDGLREVVAGAGILFPHQNDRILAQEIISLEESPQKYQTVSTACGKRSQCFEISTMASSYTKCYNEILNK
jgi:glycosyltransferase involved in cell wall biosynthesis